MPGGGVEENWGALEQKAKELNSQDDAPSSQPSDTEAKLAPPSDTTPVETER